MATYAIALVLHPELNGNATVDAIRNALSMSIANPNRFSLRLDRLDNGDVSTVFITVSFVSQDRVIAVMERIARNNGVASVEGPGFFAIGAGSLRPLSSVTGRSQAVIEDRVKALEASVTDVETQLQRQVTQIQFVGEPFHPAATLLLVDIPIEVADSNGIRSAYPGLSTIQVDITGGSATGKKLSTPDGGVVGAVDASITVPMVDGRVLIRVEASGTGTVNLKLVDVGATGLDVSDLATITFS